MPTMPVPNQGQSRTHRAQGIPQLNIQAPDVVESAYGLSPGNFEEIGHQSALFPDSLMFGRSLLKRERMPVMSKRRSNRSSKPCNLISVFWARATFNASMRVATPELSICVTADKSMVTVPGWREFKSA